jgi:hypothetical protein
MRLESVKASSSKGMPCGHVYAVEGRPGVYRRVHRSASGCKVTREGAFLATCPDTGLVIELVVFQDLAVELAEAGFVAPAGIGVGRPPADFLESQGDVVVDGRELEGGVAAEGAEPKSAQDLLRGGQ